MAEQNVEDVTSAKFHPLRNPETVTTHSNVPIKQCNIPVDYEFNDLLTNIAKQLSTDDIEEIKTRLKGDRGLKRRVRENIKSGFELFEVLQGDSLIDRDNLLLLQALLYRMKKHELFDQAVEYAQKEGNVIHFKKPQNQPPNGYTYVKIHIGGVNTDGQNIDQYSRSLLEGLKADAARLMFVPPEHVVIAGIEPSNSLLITLMIQTEHVRYLKRAAEGKDCIKEWVHFGVDFITIGGEDYFLTDKSLSRGLESETEKKLKNYFELYEEADKKLECKEVEIMELKREIQSFTKTNKSDSVRTDPEAEKTPVRTDSETDMAILRRKLDHLTQTNEEAHRKLKVNEETILQLKKQLFDSKQKNERYEMDKKLIDFIYNEFSQTSVEENQKRRPYSSGTLWGKLRRSIDEYDLESILSRQGLAQGSVKKTTRPVT